MRERLHSTIGHTFHHWKAWLFAALFEIARELPGQLVWDRATSTINRTIDDLGPSVIRKVLWTTGDIIGASPPFTFLVIVIAVLLVHAYLTTGRTKHAHRLTTDQIATTSPHIKPQKIESLNLFIRDKGHWQFRRDDENGPPPWGWYYVIDLQIINRSEHRVLLTPRLRLQLRHSGKGRMTLETTDVPGDVYEWVSKVSVLNGESPPHLLSLPIDMEAKAPTRGLLIFRYMQLETRGPLNAKGVYLSEYPPDTTALLFRDDLTGQELELPYRGFTGQAYEELSASIPPPLNPE